VWFCESFRFDHPATQCHIMSAEIDRRLASTSPGNDRESN
jgi:hypothetical protein